MREEMRMRKNRMVAAQKIGSVPPPSSPPFNRTRQKQQGEQQREVENKSISEKEQDGTQLTEDELRKV